MSIADKLANAKKTSWVSEGFSDTEIKTMVELAKISARIERCRNDMRMTQKEFADYMGVSQGMVSKWESREYNFTIKTLNDICEKIDLELTVRLEKTCIKADYTIVRWDSETVGIERKENEWVMFLPDEEGIA
ncbi:MAG: helix-turn-helix domain-containing protein [Lachnospiraceae bacterium]|nr:helix-turn-helix domain-containing protein [Lachnospiraceae bacterium]